MGTQLAVELAQDPFLRALRVIRERARPRRAIARTTAEKFSVRGYVELFDEMTATGTVHGRSLNSEIVLAILGRLSGLVREKQAIGALEKAVGQALTEAAKISAPSFKKEDCRTSIDKVVRLPEGVRDEIKAAIASSPKPVSMNHWIVDAVIEWINIQHQHYSLLSALTELSESTPLTVAGGRP